MKYSERTRSVAYSMLFVVPLLGIYELWLIIRQPRVVNAAGQIVRLPLMYIEKIIENLGGTSFFTVSILLNVALIGVFVWAYFKTRKDENPHFSTLWGVVSESVVYGFLLGHVIIFSLNLLRGVPQLSVLSMAPRVPETLDPVFLSIGAGVYEEIVFRLAVVGGLYYIGTLVFERDDMPKACGLTIGFGVVIAAIQVLSDSDYTSSWSRFGMALFATSVVFAGVSLLIAAAYCGMVWVLKQFKFNPKWAAGAVSVIIGSLVFSAFHHMGPLGEPFVFQVFSFRFMAGVLLAAIFFLRGLSVAVYTHVFYDIFVVLSD